MPITLRSTSGLAMATLAALVTAGALAGPAAAAPSAIPPPAPPAPTSDETYILPSAIAFQPTHAYVPSAQGGQTSSSPTPESTSVTLPLYTGTAPDGTSVGYVVTESSDASDSTSLGVNYSPKLANARGTAAVQSVSGSSASLHFTGSVDFAANRAVTPGAAPNYFPPTAYAPGGTGDSHYSPLTTLGNGIVRNTPVVTNRTGRSDSVVSTDPTAHTVTLHLFGGFYNGHQVLYIPAESSSPLISAIESSTYTPNLAAAPGLADDDPATSAREGIVPVVNGPLAGSGNGRQGLDSALKGEGAPLNIIQEEPSPPSEGPSNYSPVWDITPAFWTRTTNLFVVQDIASVKTLADSGQFTSYASGPHNEEIGLNASGDVSLCPVIVVFGGDPSS